MSTLKLRAALPAVLVVASLGGFALGQFRLHPAAEKTPPPSVSPYSAPLIGTPDAKPAAPVTSAAPTTVYPAAAAAPKAEEAKPASGRRREAVIKLPVGTFVKDMDVGGFGAGRLTWTFEDDKVFGTIEANVMGVEVEMRTEAEVSLSSTGTIYGLVTRVEMTHLKIGGGALGMLGEIGEYAKFVKLAEPLLIEMMTDLPFSYQFRVSGDKLTILNYRMLLAGPNPLGKLGGLIGGDSGLGVLSYFQAISIAIEGTYTADAAENRDKPKTRPLIRKPAGANNRETPVGR
jgi:hypothetical protein